MTQVLGAQSGQHVVSVRGIPSIWRRLAPPAAATCQKLLWRKARKEEKATAGRPWHLKEVWLQTASNERMWTNSSRSSSSSASASRCRQWRRRRSAESKVVRFGCDRCLRLAPRRRQRSAVDVHRLQRRRRCPEPLAQEAVSNCCMSPENRRVSSESSLRIRRPMQKDSFSRRETKQQPSRRCSSRSSLARKRRSCSGSLDSSWRGPRSRRRCVRKSCVTK
mmetsp:Transcript_11248/g.25811  ORF Transcript_11248/g.25811 Transcript_11248/m.25811 type:complete len:221 (-) Transcript_11248:536-1198(-)